jgi:hypothetical protein
VACWGSTEETAAKDGAQIRADEKSSIGEANTIVAGAEVMARTFKLGEEEDRGPERTKA